MAPGTTIANLTPKMHEKEKQPRRASSFHRGVLFTGSGTAANIALLFVETMVIVRLVPPDSYGIYVLLIAVVNFFVMAVDFGFKTAVTQLIASSDRIRQTAVAHNAILLRLAAITVASALIWLGQEMLLLLDPTQSLLQYTPYVPVMLFAASFDELFSAVLQGFQAYRHMAIAQISRSALRLCLTISFLTILKLGVLALVYSWVLSFAISVTYQYLVLPISRRFAYQHTLLMDMLRFGFPLQATRFLWFAFSRVNVLLVGALAGPASVAFYDVAARIPDALQRFSESFTSVYFPTMTALLASGKRRQAFLTLNQSLRLISFAASLMALLAVLFSREIVGLLFSEKYAASSQGFALLMIALHMTFMVNVMGYTLTSAGYPGRSLGEDVTRTTSNTIGDLLLIPAFDFMGSVFATVAAAYIANPVAIWLLRRSKIAVTVAPLAKQTVLLLVCAALFWWLPPIAFVHKAAIVVLFVVLNVLLSTISTDDVSLVLPHNTVWRLGAREGLLPDGK